MLEVACTQLPCTQRYQDPLREQIVWYASTRLSHLQKFDKFRQLLESCGDVGRQLCLLAGNSSAPKPARAFQGYRWVEMGSEDK